MSLELRSPVEVYRAGKLYQSFKAAILLLQLKEIDTVNGMVQPTTTQMFAQSKKYEGTHSANYKLNYKNA